MDNKHNAVPEDFIEFLLQERDLLHLILYRNKNQHRPSVWFKWLRMLKRDMEKLLVASGELLPMQLRKAKVPKKKLGGKGRKDDGRESTRTKSKSKRNDQLSKGNLRETKGKQNKPTTSTVVEDSVYNEAEFKRRIAHFWNVIIPGCHLAFTHLITNTQFANMGMVLLAVLARVHSLLAQHFPKETIEAEKVQDRERQRHIIAGDAVQSDDDDDNSMADYGEVVDRESITIQIRQDAGVTERDKGDLSGTKVAVEENKADSEPKTGNAIDDLFDNLF